MAKAAGVSHTMVGRIWRTFRLQRIARRVSRSRRIRNSWRRFGTWWAVRGTATNAWSSRWTRNRRSRRCNVRNHPAMDFGNRASDHNYVRMAPGSVRGAQCGDGRGDRRCKPNIGRRTLSPLCARSNRASSRSRHPRRPRQSLCASRAPVQRWLLRIHASSFTSHRPTRRGSTWSNASSACSPRKRLSAARTPD